jgi:hypothetical protein
MCWSKRTGLDKALYRIEQALDRSYANGNRQEEEQAAVQLQQLLSKTQGLLPRQPTSGDLIPDVQVQLESPQRQGPNNSLDHLRSSIATDVAISGRTVADDGYALEDAENPLQLLARASDLPASTDGLSAGRDHPNPVSAVSYPDQARPPMGNLDLAVYFGPLTPHLDIGEEIDPIDMGFVTPAETDVLFSL